MRKRERIEERATAKEQKREIEREIVCERRGKMRDKVR